MDKVIFFNIILAYKGENSNFGDLLLTKSIIEEVKSKMSIEPYIFVFSPFIKKIESYKTVSFFKLLFLSIIHRKIFSYLIYAGGDVIQDRTTKMVLPFQYIPLLFHRRLNIKVFGISIGISDFYELSKVGRKIGKHLLGSFDLLIVRDYQSYINSYKLNCKVNAIISYDYSFNYLSKFKQSPEKKYITVIPRSILTFKGYNSIILFFIDFFGLLFLYEVFFDKVAIKWCRIIKQAINYSETNSVHLIPFFKGKGSSRDDVLSKIIIRKCKKYDIKLIKINKCDNIINHIKKSELVITSTFHGSIISSVFNKKLISISIASKIKRLQSIDWFKDKIISSSDSFNLPDANLVNSILKNNLNVNNKIQMDLDLILKANRKSLDIMIRHISKE